MKKHKWILLFLLVSLFACNDDDNIVFEVATEDLKLSFRPVPGGSVMKYTLPDNEEIFGMNVRYKDFRGEPVFKTCGYGGDSLLLDGFIQECKGVTAYLTLVNHRKEESEPQEITFDTKDSAPWAFFNEDNLEVSPSWNGFRVVYKPSDIATGMAHVFYLGINPTTQKEDTILLKSFPILAGGDTLSFSLQQEKSENTIIVRTEDFRGYRVKQQIFPKIDAFRTEKWKITADDCTLPVGRFSQENDEAKTGKQYLFDGELKGKERMIGLGAQEAGGREGVVQIGGFLAGPNAFEKGIVLDLKEQKIPAWIRMYSLLPMSATFPASNQIFAGVWLGSYVDKLPCKVSVYGSNDQTNWELLGTLNQDPSVETMKDWWAYRTTQASNRVNTMEALDAADPIYVDVELPPTDNAYRYLKFIVHDTFDSTKIGINSNPQNYFTLHELEVYVKKETKL